jgi:hypothetical protein
MISRILQLLLIDIMAVGISLGRRARQGTKRRRLATKRRGRQRAPAPADFAPRVGQKPRLLPQEVAAGGVFAPLHAWLDEHIAQFGFFRPYREHRGGMFAEPWHLSFAPSAEAALKAFDIDVLEGLIASREDMLGRELALEMLPEIARRHILDVDLS